MQRPTSLIDAILGPSLRGGRSFLYGALFALLVGQPALAATPADNQRLRDTQDGLLGSHIASVAAGIGLPGWFGTGAEVAALGTDIGLKNTAPTLEVPGDITTFANAPKADHWNSEACEYRPYRPANEGTREEQSALFYWQYDRLDSIWGELGRPAVRHPHADVAVSLAGPHLSTFAFPEGRHTLSWSATTSMNYVTDVALPGALIGLFSYAEGQLARRLSSKATAKVAAKGGGRSAARAAEEAAEKTAGNIFKLVGVATDLGLMSADISNAAEAMDWYRATSVDTASNRASQTITVWDAHSPYAIDADSLPLNPGSRQDRIVEQSITAEATDFGGVRLGRIIDDLRAGFVAVDDCGKLMRVVPESPNSRLLPVDVESELTWTLEEVNGGPYRADFADIGPNQQRVGETIETTFRQRVTVVDTQAPLLLPPSGFARYADGPLTFAATPEDQAGKRRFLGRPRVVDLADPSPEVGNDAPNRFDVGQRYRINWWAEDASTNRSDAGPGYVQTITLKAPGTNTRPEAFPATASTTTATAVEIELTGRDYDLIEGQGVDPLAFEIVDYPQRGEFEAPLYPYFIEDFRLTPVGEREDGDDLTRVSPLRHLADTFRLLDKFDRGQFLEDEICLAPPGSQNAEVFGNRIPLDVVYQPSYVHVDDEGNYFIRDMFWGCAERNGPDYRHSSGSLEPLPRISRWRADGSYVGMHALYPANDPGIDDSITVVAGLTTNDAASRSFSVDRGGRIWINFSQIITTFSQGVTLTSLSTDLSDPRRHGGAGYSEQELIFGYGFTEVAGDSELGLLFELHADRIRVREILDEFELSSEDGLVGEIPGPYGFIDGGPFGGGSGGTFGRDIKVDRNGYVYVLGVNRIHKYTPTVRDSVGRWQLGEYVGWLGNCSDNRTNEAGVEYSACDRDRGVSKGFACTDEKCEIAYETIDVNGRPRTVPAGASGEGQFDAPQSFEIDPRNVIYVADTGNARVQRFSQDGAFAGQAESTGTGINQGDEPGFILGNMGNPTQLSVNSNSFYVMEQQNADGDFFVHVFRTLPFYDVTDSSAKVRYVSDFRFQGNDWFTYVVDDGIDKGGVERTEEPARVDVTVTRAFRPPERLKAECFASPALEIQVPCEVDEDASIYIRLSASDPDGFVSTGGLDTLTIDLLSEPAHGQLLSLSTEDNSELYLYTPVADYNGDDSLTFEASDGVNRSAEPFAADIIVRPLPDPVVIDMPATATAALGFRKTFSAEFSDVDEDPDFQPSLAWIDWGDDSGTSGPDWQNSGHFDPNGREISPQLDARAGSGVLLSSHTYLGVGSYTLSAGMLNAEEEGLPASQAATTVQVIPATVVSADIASPEDPVDPDVAFPLVIDVTNVVPENWPGLPANDTRLTISVPEGLTILGVDPACAPGDPIDCDLGDLAQGQTASVTLTAIIDYESAVEIGEFSLTLETIDAGPKASERSISMASVDIADEDDDNVPDVDDMYPTDPRYSRDSDGDGLADAWERRHGFDPGVIDDVSADADGDGYTLLEEFRNDSYPYLAEEQVMQAGERLPGEETSDILTYGQVIAGGDLDGDGFADTLIGAPGHGGGAVHVVYGGADRTRSGEELLPGLNVTGYGRALAVGDFDGNGYGDVAVGHANGVDIRFNNGSILAAPDLALAGTGSVGGFGAYLRAGDLDGDGIDDLVVTARPGGTTGEINVYRSTAGGFGAPPLVLASTSAAWGDSVAIGDIDGDGAPDLVVGAGFAAAGGRVHGFLAADNDWQTAAALVTSFVLPAPAGFSRFGFSVASGGDIGGDGIDDLVVGAYAGAGSVAVYDSATGYWVPDDASLLSSVPPAQSFAGMDDATAPGDTRAGQLGVRVDMAYLDADGYADVVAGANRAGSDDEGRVRIFSGSAAGLETESEVEEGDRAGGMLGYWVNVPGDIDGDGFDDVVAGAPTFNRGGGYARVYSPTFVALDPDAALDIDGDGVPNDSDDLPLNPNETVDTDGDGVGDNGDVFPENPDEWADTDGDGVGDNGDAFPNDPAETSDSDADGVGDNGDAFPNDATETVDTDLDGIGDNADPDDDNDGVEDSLDAFPRGQFADARPGSWAFSYIESLGRAGITGGCGGGNYCPGDRVSRAQMSVFLIRGMYGSDFVPAAATGSVFDDVDAGDFAAAFIEQLRLEGITGGCGNGNYCPADSVTRAQMAVFLLRARYGRDYLPPAPSGIFGDVGPNHWAAAWIDQLASEGITGGCGGGNYCPDDVVDRAQMAVFLVRTFDL